MTTDKNDSPSANQWAGPDGELGTHIAEEAKKTLNAYREQPHLVNEHANFEEDTARGGYAHRQLFELVQNGADALADKPGGGRIELRLTEDSLYCADNGEPIDRAGVTALMFSHLSPKRGSSEIGRFGLGFKSVLGVTHSPEFFSRSGSFRFDRERSRQIVGQVVHGAERYPVLRLPEPFDPFERRVNDAILRELMDWATNIIRLPLISGAIDNLSRQMGDFPAEFLLFVEHVHRLTLKNDISALHQTLELQNVDGDFLLAVGDTTRQWKLFKHTHPLSNHARDDRRSLDDGDEVPIWWAVPLDRLTDPGRFWAFFPTKTASLVVGILNAPWKTNEDRQNLLSGPYNEELIESAARMVADKLPELATRTDPARHLDALPRRREAGDTEQVDQLRAQLYSSLLGREIVPDQDGKLRAATMVSYPPKELTTDRQMVTAPLERWTAHPGRPPNWLHEKAYTRNRLSAIDRLFLQKPPGHIAAAPRATIAEWLEALVEHPEPEMNASASKSAIQTAALIPHEIRSCAPLGDIVLTGGGDWQSPDPAHVFLPDDSPDSRCETSANSFVHPELTSDGNTLAALRVLGIRPPSPDSRFKFALENVLSGNMEPEDDDLEEFWRLSRRLTLETVLAAIQERKTWRKNLRIRTRSDSWRHIHSVLLPGEIVPGDGSRDDSVTVDVNFHEGDLELLRALGAANIADGERDTSSEPWFRSFLLDCRRDFKARDLRRDPQGDYLTFASTRGSGPLDVLTKLSDEGRTAYTAALLSLDATYSPWTMRHETQAIYPELSCRSPAIFLLSQDGRIRTPGGIVPFSHALGSQPKSPAALYSLLAHPKADRIKEAFDLTEPIPEFVDEEDPIPLTDVWPGLARHLPAHRGTCRLIRCNRILIAPGKRNCVLHASDVYVVNTDDGEQELRFVLDALELGLSERQAQEILEYETQREIEELRAAVGECSTDAERLLVAVGEQALRRNLPSSLLAVLENDGIVLTGLQIAETAIATYHSDALRQYRWELEHLGPPSRWAGSARAVDFVCSLGFSAEWAGERTRNRDPFLEVEGPYALPDLHDYQRSIAGNIKSVLRTEHGVGAERRGMISMPTGSGKTRVAVQAIVEAIRDDGFPRGVLWVADRDELCEQAVEAWRQVWSSIGAQASRLRISRLWAGQPRPMPTNELHIVVATIQTLNAKFSNQRGEYEFLADFELVVFDEAHRSIAPTFTSVMQDIGLTRFQRADEPFLLGLTATPYRGQDEVETARLVSRYGSKRLDSGTFASDDPQAVIQELQRMSVLAQVDHGIIKGETFSSDTFPAHEWEQILEELERAVLLPWLPQSVEDRIAQSAERTKRIVEAYEAHIDPRWPTLIFATSVEHAKTVAALLNARGVKSRAVSGATEISTRRRVVEEFRNGGIQALVNYGVFQEGFDAPKTRAIIVARPVYSPNLYFQMIGRGLRGVRNGGGDRCLILNVRDNIENFKRVLAFSELDWLWA